MKSNLLKKDMDCMPTEDLNVRFCYILDRAEKLKAEEIPISDAREVLWIEEILHSRLIKQLGRNPYPPDRIEKEKPSNYMISLLKSRQAKPEATPGIKIKFKITVTSSIGSKVAEENVSVDSRSEADLLATKMIRDLGLRKATYKIS